MSTWLHDLRESLRTLYRRPLHALTVALVLAVGIGVNTTIFSVVDSVLLRSLPLTEADQLVHLTLTRLDRGGHYAVPYHHFRAWRESAHSFVDVAAMLEHVYVLDEGTGGERLYGREVSSDYFRTLGVEPRLGRAFAKDDATGEPVAVISHGLWQRRFGGDPDIVGRRLVLDREPRTVVGVMPASSPLSSIGWRDVWTPMRESAYAGGEKPVWGFTTVARLRAGAEIDTAQRDVDAIAARLAAENPEHDHGWGVEVVPVADALFGHVRTPLVLAYATSVLLLLVACGTVSNLTSAAATTRWRDIAVRKALGASPAQLLRQLLLESVLLAAAAGLAGFFAARALVRLLPALVPRIPRIDDLQVDLRVLAVALATALAAGVVSGLFPALALARTPTGLLRSAGECAGGGRGVHRTRHVLVAAETALAMVAILAAGLLVKSLAELRAVDPGFETGSLLTLRIDVPEDRYPEPDARRTSIEELIDRVAVLPGVEAAGATGVSLPMMGDHGIFELFVEGRERTPHPDVLVHAQYVSAGFREALGMKLVEGRWFEDGETWESKNAVVVNETFVRRYWPDRDPIGRWVEWSSGDRGRVLGVVADVRQLALHLEPIPEAFIAWGPVKASQALVVRTSASDPTSLVEAIRREVSGLFPGAPVYGVKTGEEMVLASYADRRLWTILIGTFALLAVGLGGLGFYGVVAHSVSSRDREIGVRMALGALPEAILRLIVRQSLRPVAVGIVVGVGLALGATRWLESQLYEVSTRDPSTFGWGVAAILASALAVCVVPALRAARVDPAVAVRGGE